MRQKVNVVWFKRDLRIYDHQPLFAAASSGCVLPLYVIEPELWQQPDSSSRHWHFIHDCLVELGKAMNSYGGRLIIRIGDIILVLNDLSCTLGAFNLCSHEETGNAWTYKRDVEVLRWCNERQVQWQEFQSNGVVRGLKSRDIWSVNRDQIMAKPICGAPESIEFVANIESCILPAKTDSLFGPLPSGNTQTGGRVQGLYVLSSFLKERAFKYMSTISKPGVSARHCSRLSTHIAYGTLSVREIEQATKQKIQDSKGDNNHENLARNLSAFLSRLAWRCHFVQKLEQQYDIETKCMHPIFEGMREPYFREDYFNAWKSGNTGYPIVDACMRSLIDNGWLNFRMRAMLVSFASYNLWLDWRQTAPYLARLFTDYEPGIHYSQFQMQSGVTGINAIRIYNPIKQSTEQDQEAKFIRRYVPELKDVPDALVHTPWLWDKALDSYPRPIVDHDLSIKYARSKLSERFRHEDFKDQAKDVLRRLGSRKRTPARAPKVKNNPGQMLFDFG